MADLDQKADRYLTEGRISVRSADWSTPMARVEVYGSAEKPYTVQYLPGTGWACTCPAQRLCAHVMACQRVFRFKATRTIRLGDPADELTRFLADTSGDSPST